MSKFSFDSDGEDATSISNSDSVDSSSDFSSSTEEIILVQTETLSSKVHQRISQYKEKIYNIAILLTGSIEDAETIVEEVFEKISSSVKDVSLEPLDSLIHRLTYDASLEKLLFQVDDCAAELEETGMQILDSPAYLC